jgi:hypothetical protein
MQTWVKFPDEHPHPHLVIGWTRSWSARLINCLKASTRLARCSNHGPLQMPAANACGAKWICELPCGNRF